MGNMIDEFARPRRAWGMLLACALAYSPAAHGAGASGAATAVTLRPLSIVNTEDLVFGTLLRGTTAGTAVIDPDTGGRSVTGGVLPAGGSPRAAQFFTYGGPNQNLQVNRGPLPVLNRAGGGASMNVTQLTLNGPTLRFLNSAGVLDLRVGGTLAVAANQQEGDYSGTFQIIVTYF